MNSIKVVNLPELAEVTGQRKVLMNGPSFHTWLNIYEPGQIDEMHCHNADQTFYCVGGECTVHFPDGGKEVMTPGCLALMPGGHFYQLENTGTDRMVMLGARALNSEQSLKIDYETRKPISYREKSTTPPTGTRVLV